MKQSSVPDWTARYPHPPRQYAGLVDQARVEGRNNRGGGNRLLEETASAKPDKQFGGLVGEAQVAGRRDRNKEFGGLVGEAQVAGRRRGRGGNHMRVSAWSWR